MSEENLNCCSEVGGYLTAFTIGALLGAGLAVIYAPCSGKETREALARQTEELKEKASSVVTGARELFREKKADIVAAVQAGVNAMQED